jgi:cell division protein ZapA
MSDDNRVIKVHIFGEDYPIRGDFESGEDAEKFRQHVLDVARYVDQKMHEIAERSANRTPKNIAILTVLNIADELLKLKNEQEGELTNFRQIADSLADRLDEKLLSASS